MYPFYCTKKIDDIIYKKENYGLEDNYWKIIVGSDTKKSSI